MEKKGEKPWTERDSESESLRERGRRRSKEIEQER
jgi:hypothetical protein